MNDHIDITVIWPAEAVNHTDHVDITNSWNTRKPTFRRGAEILARDGNQEDAATERTTFHMESEVFRLYFKPKSKDEWRSTEKAARLILRGMRIARRNGEVGAMGTFITGIYEKLMTSPTLASLVENIEKELSSFGGPKPKIRGQRRKDEDDA